MSRKITSVEDGAKWLDGIRPEWFTLVNTDILNMSSTRKCVLGQVFADKASSYSNGYSYAEYEYPFDDYTSSDRNVFADFDEEWIKEINKRRNKPEASDTKVSKVADLKLGDKVYNDNAFRKVTGLTYDLEVEGNVNVAFDETTMPFAVNGDSLVIVAV